MAESKMKKLLLMGRSNAGKTSMHSIIFANLPARETLNIGFTVDINENKIRFMGNLQLNLWDCGGQDKLMKQYFTTQREQIFKNVQVLIYVFDVENEAEVYERDLQDYGHCIKNLSIYSPNAIIFILVHKMDRIRDIEKQQVFNTKKNEITKTTQENSQNVEMTIKEIFATTIWDETLYKAWSQIVQLLIPNMSFIKDSLKQFSAICECDEIVLFEKSTFLIIAYHEKGQRDILKYERLSNIIKQFKLSCNKIGALLRTVTVKNSNFTAFIQEFTENTYILVVFTDQKIQPAAIELNIDCAKSFFNKTSKNEPESLLYAWNK